MPGPLVVLGRLVQARYWLGPALAALSAGRRTRAASTWRRDMAKIKGKILIGQPVEEVFDFVADSRNEP